MSDVWPPPPESQPAENPIALSLNSLEGVGALLISCSAAFCFVAFCLDNSFGNNFNWTKIYLNVYWFSLLGFIVFGPVGLIYSLIKRNTRYGFGGLLVNLATTFAVIMAILLQ